MAWTKRKKKDCLFIGTPNYGNTDQFTIKLCHEGKFSRYGEACEYVGGKVTWFDYFEPDLMSLIELKNVVKEAGVKNENYLLLQRVPKGPFDDGLRAIDNDNQAFDISMFIPENKVVEIYVEFNLNVQPINMKNSKKKKGKKAGGNVDGAGSSHASKRGRDSEEECDSAKGSLHDSEYECEDEVATIEAVQGKGKGKLIEWSFGEGLKGVNTDAVYDSDDGLMNYQTDSDGELKLKSRGRVFNPKVDMEKPVFELKMQFRDHKIFQEAVRRHAILESRQIFFTKQNRDKVRAVCKAPCEWMIYAAKTQQECILVVKTLNPVHSCPTHYKNHHVKSTWLAKEFVSEWRSNPTKPIKSFQELVFNKTKVNISKQQAYRSKKKAFNLINGSIQDQYSRLWDYAEELRNRNPGSSVYVKVEEGSIEHGYPVLSRLYVCLSGLKQGVKLCRKLISVDGCFLKGEYGGQILSACGIDPNNNWFPFCWTIVEAETKDTWNWFLKLIVEDLEIRNSELWTIISDKQKGLIDAVATHLPEAEHRYCVLHMLGNMRAAGFKGLVYKDFLWSAASATTKSRFSHFMGELEKYDKQAFDWFADKSPDHWSRSHFRTDNQCDILTNNMSESFNSFILPARDMPVLACLETIRNMVMTRLGTNREEAEKK